MKSAPTSISILHPKAALLEALLTEQQAAPLLGFSVSAMRQDRVTKRHGIPYIKIGANVRYRPSEIVAWLDRHSVRLEVESA